MAHLSIGVRPARFGNVLEALTGGSEPSLFAGELLETTKRLVAVGGIEFDQSGLPAGLFRRDQRGAGPAEGIEDDFISPRTVLDGIGDEPDRLDGRVHGKVLHAS